MWLWDKVKKEKVSSPEQFYQEHIELAKELGEKMPKQLIHRDPYYGNIILEDGKCAGFLQNPAEGIWLPIYHNIVEGYETENPLTEDERKALHIWFIPFK